MIFFRNLCTVSKLHVLAFLQVSVKYESLSLTVPLAWREGNEWQPGVQEVNSMTAGCWGFDCSPAHLRSGNSECRRSLSNNVSPCGSGANEGWRQPCQSSQTRGRRSGRGRRSRDVWQNTPLKRPFITLPNQAERGEVYNCGHQLLSHWSCRYFTVMCYHYEWVCVKFMNFIYFLSFSPPPQSCERLPPRFILSSNDNIQLTYLIPQYVHMETGVRRVGRRWKKNNAQMKTLCLAELLIAWVPFSRQISPRGWLNTIAVPSSKSQVCAAKHATRQWKLAVWMMVITLATEAANASFQEGAVWWASLMSVQEQEFIYLL